MQRNRPKKSMTDSSEVYAVFGNTPYYLRPQSEQVQTRSPLKNSIEREKFQENNVKTQKMNATTLDQKWQHFLQVKALRASGQISPPETFSEKKDFPEKKTFSKSQEIHQVKQSIPEETISASTQTQQKNTTTMRPHVTFSSEVLANSTRRRKTRY